MENNAAPYLHWHTRCAACSKVTLARCSNPKNPGFKSYGGRGIAVQAEWDCSKTGFQSFLDHVGLMPEPGLSLDRIDNDRGYAIGNCRWASPQSQSGKDGSNVAVEG
jgi:hypothetical protein